MRPSTRSPRRRLSTLAHACADIIDAIGHPELPSTIARALSTLVDFDVCTAVLFEKNCKPQIMYGGDDVQHDEGHENYANFSFALGPAYRLFESGQLSGVYRMRDMPRMGREIVDPRRYRVSVSASEEMGYLTDGLRPGNEELFVGLEICDGVAAQITLFRRRTANGFTSGELELVDAAKPILGSALKQFWKSSTGPSQDRSVPSMQSSALAILSPREFEIANLLVEGHSSLSLSLLLGISITTVKTHRRNLYAKLGIATHFELFSLYLRDMKRGSSIRP